MPHQLFIGAGAGARIEAAIAAPPRLPFRTCRAAAGCEGGVDLGWVYDNSDTAWPWLQRTARVLSQLDNIEVLSWKSNLALLQHSMPLSSTPVLSTEVLLGEDHLENWIKTQLRQAAAITATCTGGDKAGKFGCWIVKDALANGGEQVWLLDASNWRRVLATLRAQAAAATDGTAGTARLFVVQEYVERPLLWPLAGPTAAVLPLEPPQGRKFHWRVFGVLTGDLRAFLFHRAFAHVANAPYKPPTQTASSGATAARTGRGGEGEGVGAQEPAAARLSGWGALYSRSVHISNVGPTMRAAQGEEGEGWRREAAAPTGTSCESGDRFAPYPEADLPLEQPEAWAQACEQFGALVAAARPFMGQWQRSSADFALLGIDWLPDSDGKLWLLEVNAPPSLAEAGLYCDGEAEADARLNGAAGAAAAEVGVGLGGEAGIVAGIVAQVGTAGECSRGREVHPETVARETTSVSGTKCARSNQGQQQRRPDWGGPLIIAMLRQLLRRFVLPHCRHGNSDDDDGQSNGIDNGNSSGKTEDPKEESQGLEPRKQPQPQSPQQDSGVDCQRGTRSQSAGLRGDDTTTSTGAFPYNW